MAYGNRNDITGERFGRWTVLGVGKTKRFIFWKCRCDCGCEKEVAGYALRRGRTKSCGCYSHELSRTHGLSKTKFYDVWCKMISRCYKTDDPRYQDYGGRGIRMCEFLRSNPENLLHILGNKPEGKLSVGRINNDGNYCCGFCSECLRSSCSCNVRWETDKQQTRNKRNTIFLTFGGTRKPLSEWSDELGIKYMLMYDRLRNGCDVVTGEKNHG